MGTNDYASFTIAGKISASGNIMTLTDGDATTTVGCEDYCLHAIWQLPWFD